MNSHLSWRESWPAPETTSGDQGAKVTSGLAASLGPPSEIPAILDLVKPRDGSAGFLSSHRSVGCLPQCPVQDARVAEPVP
jgi:hypothetical protein